MNLTDLHTFVRVAEHGSLTGAAEALGVPKSTVSRRVARLEDELGLPLLLRSGRSVSLTDHGRHLFERSRLPLREIDDLADEIVDASAEPRGTLRVTAPYDVGNTPIFANLLARFQSAHPLVEIDVALDNRVVDLIGDGFDVALRPNAGRVSDSTSLMSRRISGQFELMMVATPAYLAEHGAPTHPDELRAHRCLAHPAMRARGGWELARGDGEPATFEVGPGLTVNDFRLLASLVLRGAGIGIAPEMLVGAGLRDGRLARVLPEWNGSAGSLWVVWPASRHTAPRVRAFVDHLTSFSEAPDPWVSEPALGPR